MREEVCLQPKNMGANDGGVRKRECNGRETRRAALRHTAPNSHAARAGSHGRGQSPAADKGHLPARTQLCSCRNLKPSCAGAGVCVCVCARVQTVPVVVAALECGAVAPRKTTILLVTADPSFWFGSAKMRSLWKLASGASSHEYGLASNSAPRQSNCCYPGRVEHPLGPHASPRVGAASNSCKLYSRIHTRFC